MKFEEAEVTNQSNPLQWHKFVTVYSNTGVKDGEVRTIIEVTPQTKEQYLDAHDYWDVLSIIEIEGKSSPKDCRCAECHKPFNIGDKVLTMESLEEKTIVFLDGHWAYFAEVYEGDDSLDMQEPCRYIIHSLHVSQDIKTEFEKGRELWMKGMNICLEIKKGLFHISQYL